LAEEGLTSAAKVSSNLLLCPFYDSAIESYMASYTWPPLETVTWTALKLPTLNDVLKVGVRV
jgi:hypothetical protein